MNYVNFFYRSVPDIFNEGIEKTVEVKKSYVSSINLVTGCGTKVVINMRTDPLQNICGSLKGNIWYIWTITAEI